MLPRVVERGAVADKPRISGGGDTAGPHSIGHSSDGIDIADTDPGECRVEECPMPTVIRRASVAARSAAPLMAAGLALCFLIERSLRW